MVGGPTQLKTYHKKRDRCNSWMGRMLGRKREPHRHYVSGATRKEEVEKEFGFPLLIIVKIVSKKFHLAKKTATDQSSQGHALKSSLILIGLLVHKKNK